MGKMGASAMLLGKSILGRDIDLYTLGEGAKSVLIVGAHHGSEYVTASVLHFLIYYSLSSEGGELGISLSHLLKTYRLFIVPLLNPDGVSLCLEGIKPSPLYERQMKMANEQGFGKWQANARGVDLNHNYGFGFYEYKKIEREKGIFPGRSLYSGEYPESEPETRALAGLVKVISPKLIISLHSQGEEIYYSPKTKRADRVAHFASAALGYKLSSATGTACYGGFCDYTGYTLGIPSLTLELGRGENPLEDFWFPILCKRLTAGLLRLITAV
jgi:g-D-glutamyl-meso-diaminopimelate peptidase